MVETTKDKDNLEIWNKLAQPPATALKTIQAGRLKGKSDINPQWRYQAMTELFGSCGIGWKYEVTNKWLEYGSNDQVFAFADINLYVKHENKWSEPIPGSGGSMLISKESSGLYSNDEAYKMAITDALGTAMKLLGVAADVYAGKWDGSKYTEQAPQTRAGTTTIPKPKAVDKDSVKPKLRALILSQVSEDMPKEDRAKVAQAILKDISSFEGKDGVTFATDIDKMSEKWAQTAYGKLKKQIEEQEKADKEADKTIEDYEKSKQEALSTDKEVKEGLG